MASSPPRPQCAWPGTAAPIAFLRFSALGASLAIEAAKLCAVLELAEAHAPARHGGGLVMLHDDEVIPLVDFRSASAKREALVGAQLLLARVHERRFGIAVDRILDRIAIAYGDIRAPDEGLARQVPSLAGSVWRDGCEIFVIDSDRLLGPAVRTYLLKGR